MYTKGQKIVCVDDKFAPPVRKLFKQLPVANVVYTVRATYVARGHLNSLTPEAERKDGEIGVLLEEIKNPADPYLKSGLTAEPGFNSERFAPLDERRQTQRAEKPIRQPRPERIRRPELVPAE